MEERDRFCREVKAEEERRIEEELIFQPQIVTRYYQSDKHYSNTAGIATTKKEEELMLYGRMLNEKKEMARIINDQYEESKFNFVPTINKKSEKIVNQKYKYGNPSCFNG